MYYAVGWYDVCLSHICGLTKKNRYTTGKRQPVKYDKEIYKHKWNQHSNTNVYNYTEFYWTHLTKSC
jgi:hypothetical protein